MFTSLLEPYISDWPLILKVGALGAFIATFVFLRYLFFTGAAFGVSQLVRKLAPARRLQSLPFTWSQISREIRDSLISVMTFTAIVGVILLMSMAGWTRIYSDPGALGWTWFWLQIPLALLIQDWYFYWMHRAIHSPSLYNRIHKTHHLSTNPSAFAAFAFHPLEAVLEIAVFVAIVVLIPMTPLALLAVSLFSLAYNVYGHLGYEIMPRFVAKSPLGYILNKSAYHNQHHRTYRYNYGLYTVIWDRLHGTLHPKADQLYDAATDHQPDAKGVGSH